MKYKGKEISEDDAVECVNHISSMFLDMTDPTEKVCLTAVSLNGCLIKHIENPTEEMKLIAVKQDRFAIHYIENPSEEIQLEAYTADRDSYQYIENPCPKVKQLHEEYLLIEELKK